MCRIASTKNVPRDFRFAETYGWWHCMEPSTDEDQQKAAEESRREELAAMERQRMLTRERVRRFRERKKNLKKSKR